MPPFFLYVPFFVLPFFLYMLLAVLPSKLPLILSPPSLSTALLPSFLAIPPLLPSFLLSVRLPSKYLPYLLLLTSSFSSLIPTIPSFLLTSSSSNLFFLPSHYLAYLHYFLQSLFLSFPPPCRHAYLFIVHPSIFLPFISYIYPFFHNPPPSSLPSIITYSLCSVHLSFLFYLSFVFSSYPPSFLLFIHLPSSYLIPEGGRAVCVTISHLRQVFTEHD